MANNNTVETDAVIETEAVNVKEPITVAHLDFTDVDGLIAKIEAGEITCECQECLTTLAGHMEAADQNSEEAADMLSGIELNPENFVSNLGYMGTGMLGIFIVIALIMATTTFLNKAFSGKKKEESAE